MWFIQMIGLIKLSGCFDGLVQLVGPVVGTRSWFNWLLHVVDPHGSIGGFNRLVRAIGSCGWFVSFGLSSLFNWLVLVSSIGWSI